MKESVNLGLNLPDLGDQYNLEHWNENMETLDSVIHSEQVKTQNLQTYTTAISNQEIDTIMSN